jgi:hypothetical protein
VDRHVLSRRPAALPLLGKWLNVRVVQAKLYPFNINSAKQRP